MINKRLFSMTQKKKKHLLSKVGDAILKEGLSKKIEDEKIALKDFQTSVSL